MSSEEDDPEEKVGPTVRYLQKLGAEHLAVILDASRWVFAQDTDAGLQVHLSFSTSTTSLSRLQLIGSVSLIACHVVQIFTADLDEDESLPRQKVMAHLESVSRDVCIRYLEHVIHQLGEQGAEFHEKLIDLYLQTLHATKSCTFPRSRCTPHPRRTVSQRPDHYRSAARNEAVYKKLLDLLESSTSYRADRILGRIPSEDMQDARAVLLGRLGRHEGALQIYVYQLEDHTTAEQCVCAASCVRVS